MTGLFRTLLHIAQRRWVEGGVMYSLCNDRPLQDSVTYSTEEMGGGRARGNVLTV